MAQTVLLVEDDDVARMAYRECLSRAGFRVIASPDAIDGVHALEVAPEIDAIVTDIHLPGSENGFAFAARARRLDGSRPKILYYTGDHELVARNTGRSDLYGPLIERPADATLFVRAVEALLASPY